MADAVDSTRRLDPLPGFARVAVSNTLGYSLSVAYPAYLDPRIHTPVYAPRHYSTWPFVAVAAAVFFTTLLAIRLLRDRRSQQWYAVLPLMGGSIFSSLTMPPEVPHAAPLWISIVWFGVTLSWIWSHDLVSLRQVNTGTLLLAAICVPVVVAIPLLLWLQYVNDRLTEVPAERDLLRRGSQLLAVSFAAYWYAAPTAVIYYAYRQSLGISRRHIEPHLRRTEQVIMQPFDVFLCHASEDKALVVNPLAEALTAAGITHFLDSKEILWGDSITGVINRALEQAKLVVVVVSERSLVKHWPLKEMNAALAREISDGVTRVLPLLVGNSTDARNALWRQLPLQGDKLYLAWENDAAPVVFALQQVLARLDNPGR